MKQKDRSPSQILEQGDDSIHGSDASDNLTTLRGNALTYNADNQLVGPTYDGQGNPTLYNWAGTNTTFAWDAEDRLVSFGTAFTAGYRPDGLRAWKQTGVASTRHYFLYDGGHIVAELDSAGALLSAYGWGAAGLSERYVKATGIIYAYTFDPSGNLLQRHTNNTDNNGTPIYADYSTLYDGFGGQRGAVSSRSGFALVNQDPIGWGGQFGGYTDQETVAPPGSGTDPLKRFPLVLLGHRYYDPGAGRFLNRDPEGMEGGINVYAYCHNNPINFTDPSGSAEDPLPNSNKVRIVLSGFIPTVIAMTPPGMNLLAGMAHGDARGFSPNDNGRHRVNQYAVIDTKTGVVYGKASAGLSSRTPGMMDGQYPIWYNNHLTATADMSNTSVSVKRNKVGDYIIRMQGSAKYPLAPQLLTPAIQWDVTVRLDKAGNLQGISGMHTEYPAFEIYKYWGTKNKSQQLYGKSPKKGKTVLDLTHGPTVKIAK